MPSIINATTSTGLVSSADNSGSLQLATNNGTTALTIDTSQNVGIGVSTVAASGSRRVVQVANGASGGMLMLGNSGTENGNPRLFLESTNDLGLASGVTTGVMKFYTNDVTRMTIDASGRVRQPFQPAFQIKGSSGSVAVASNAVLPFNTALTNVGSHFNTSTYTFTVPVAGVYFFAISLRWENNNGSAAYWRPDFYINGATSPTYTGAIQAIAANTYAYAAQSFVVSLNAGDTCKWHYNTSGSATNNFNLDESIFSGYLLG
jgi:hypothetical protein